MDATTVAVDLAKSVFDIAAADLGGRIKVNQRLSRTRFLSFFGNPPVPIKSLRGNWLRAGDSHDFQSSY